MKNFVLHFQILDINIKTSMNFKEILAHINYGDYVGIFDIFKFVYKQYV